MNLYVRILISIVQYPKYSSKEYYGWGIMEVIMYFADKCNYGVKLFNVCLFSYTIYYLRHPIYLGGEPNKLLRQYVYLYRYILFDKKSQFGKTLMNFV